MKPMKRIRWPRKPSNVLLLALRDLELVEHDKKYRVEMTVWHDPESPRVCEVCFAGGVMAKSFEVDRNDFLDANDFRARDAEIFRALNDARSGYLNTLFDALDRPVPMDFPSTKRGEYFPAYLFDREEWWNCMLAMVGMLQAFGE